LPPINSEIEIRQIRPGDRLAGLKLGDSAFSPLKTFLQKHAQRYQEESLARTYAAFDPGAGKAIAYITLVCGEVVTAEDDAPLIDEPELDYRYPQFPAVKIARLAVDQRYRGYDLGRTLVNLALGQAKNVICPAVGCRFVVVDSKVESVRFYEKCGFTMLDTQANRDRASPVMWVDLKKAV
jgi:GNAT superfamily N-acetyltransferase